MTSYSILSSGPRFTVLATWAGVYNDHTVKVTTLDNGDLARDLAVYLTHVSEGAWDAAPWLDTYPVIEAGIAELIDHLRGHDAAIPRIDLSGDGYRHHDQWSFVDVAEVMLYLPDVLNHLTRAQRLTVADELATDAAGRAEMLRAFPAQQDPATDASRAWQALEVTRTLHNGQLGPLPEGAAGWMVRAWGSELVLVDRWAARDRLTRIEQLVAACQKFGGRATAELDPELCAHLVVPRSESVTHNDVFYVMVPSGHGGSHDERPTAPMTIKHVHRTNHTVDVVAVLEPADDDGFAKALGEWTRLVPWPGMPVPAAAAATSSPQASRA
ncbi:hypothetical protein [Amycolatopsis nalaikhensis]|uniref:Uncharacterized protein n=1 Tax=Amycolatopsis nalaikhensis TaxID=715472 RepID=A0ABY8XUL4_9PSEU|nr:hypothetical protein [Amycolatopsis sp. 2-2]WIV59171.1 hypothetical protein QP939_11340 [Amycolatopsis sp. 2-2]